MRVKRAGMGTKFVVLALLVVCVTALLSMKGRLTQAQQARDTLAQEVRDQRESNAALAEDIAGSGDPEQIAGIARDKLGLLGRDEIVFIDTSN